MEPDLNTPEHFWYSG